MRGGIGESQVVRVKGGRGWGGGRAAGEERDEEGGEERRWEGKGERKTQKRETREICF